MVIGNLSHPSIHDSNTRSWDTTVCHINLSSWGFPIGFSHWKHNFYIYKLHRRSLFKHLGKESSDSSLQRTQCHDMARTGTFKSSFCKSIHALAIWPRAHLLVHQLDFYINWFSNTNPELLLNLLYLVWSN